MQNDSPKDMSPFHDKAQLMFINAVRQNNVDAARFWAARGADALVHGDMHDRKPSGKFDHGRPGNYTKSALMLAAGGAGGKPFALDMLSFLLPLSDPNAQGGLGNGGRMGDTALMRAAWLADPIAIKALLAVSDSAVMNIRGEDALMALARNRNSASIDAIRASFALLLPRSNPLLANQKGQDALMLAAIDNHAILPGLIPVSDLSRRDALGRTALLVALNQHQEDSALVLLPYFDPRDADLDGFDAPAMAAKQGLDAFLKVLWLKDPHAFERRPGEPSLLALAASAGHHAGATQTTRFLLSLRPQDAHSVDAAGSDPLMLAIELNFNDSELAIALIEASDLTRKDELGESALDKARLRGLDHVAEAIEDRLARKGSCEKKFDAQL